MIRGRVNAGREAQVLLEVRGSDRQVHSVEAVIDTGFAGHLTLPRDVINLLELEPRGQTNVTLAGGARELWNTWRGQVLWHDRPRTIRILESRGTSLLGMQLLEDSELTIQVRAGGDVVIEELNGSGP